MIKKTIALLSLFYLGTSLILADETDEEILARILQEAVTIVVRTKLIIPEEDKTLLSDLKKVTVPGRAVTLSFEGDNEKLSIKLTPFKVEDGSYILAALSNLWVENDSGGSFKSSYRPFHISPVSPTS